MKKLNKKGFTMAELLIVVAIIAVLVAIAIPIFTTQLEKSREATDVANIRSAYAEAMTKAVSDGDGSYTATTTKASSSGDFDYADTEGISWFDLSTISVDNTKTFTVTVTVSGGTTTVTVAQP